MDEIRLIDTRFSKKTNNYVSYDLVEYNNVYYAGYNLSKNFFNHIAGMTCYNYVRFTSLLAAKRHFEEFNA